METRLALVALALLAAVPACGNAAFSSAVRPRAPVTERAVRTPPNAAPPPRLIAPPPAYGDKIVMASIESDEASN